MNEAWSAVPMLSDEIDATVAAGLVAAVVAALAVVPVRRLAVRLGAVDVPGGRHIHRRPTPRLGGIAIAVALIVAVAAVAVLWPRALDAAAAGGTLARVLAIGALVALMGARDDVRPLRATHKLLGLAVAGALLAWSGVQVQFVDLPFTERIDLGSMSWLATVVWVVACANAVNLIDGVDGCGAGVAMASAGTLALLGLATGDPAAAILCAALCGACGGFLLHNREPARIFLGDSGSLLLGFVLAAASASGCVKRATALSLFAALLALAVPLLDSTQSFLRRFVRALRDDPGRLLRALRATAVADRDHIHHRLLSRGFSHRQVARVLVAVTILSGLASLLLVEPGRTPSAVLILAVGAVVYALARLALVRAVRVVAAPEKTVVLTPAPRLGVAGPAPAASPGLTQEQVATRADATLIGAGRSEAPR